MIKQPGDVCGQDRVRVNVCTWLCLRLGACTLSSVDGPEQTNKTKKYASYHRVKHRRKDTHTDTHTSTIKHLKPSRQSGGKKSISYSLNMSHRYTIGNSFPSAQPANQLWGERTGQTEAWSPGRGYSYVISVRFPTGYLLIHVFYMYFFNLDTCVCSHQFSCESDG